MYSRLHLFVKNYFSHYSGLSKHCWQGIILSFIEATLIGVYSFLPLYFVNDLKFNILDASLIVSFYGIGAIIGGFISGKLADNFSSAKIAITCLLIQATVFLFLIHLKTFNQLALDLLVMGIASYGFLTALHLWVLNQCEGKEETKLRALNILSAASNLGGAFSAIIIGVIAQKSFHNIFYLVAVLLIISSILFLITNPYTVHPTQPKQKNPSTSPTAHSKNLTRVVIILVCLFVAGLIIFQANTTFSFYIQHKYPYLGLKGVSILFAINCLMVVLFQTPLINYFAKTNKVKLVGSGAFLLGFGMLLLPFAINYFLAVVAYIIHTLGEMLFFSVAQYVCYESVDINKKGFIIGIYRMIYASSRVIAPAAGSYVYLQWGENILWYLCGLLGLICLELCQYKKNYSILTRLR